MYFCEDLGEALSPISGLQSAPLIHWGGERCGVGEGQGPYTLYQGELLGVELQVDNCSSIQGTERQGYIETHRNKESRKQRDRHRGRERHREQEIQREMERPEVGQR